MAIMNEGCCFKTAAKASTRVLDLALAAELNALAGTVPRQTKNKLRGGPLGRPNSQIEFSINAYISSDKDFITTLST